jgi:thioredoxin 1
MSKDSAGVTVENEKDLAEILKANDRIVALFYASWCPFCARFLPVFEKQAGAGRHFIFVKDDDEEIAGRYAIDIYPTVIFFEGGKPAKRLDGKAGVGLNEKQLTEFVELCRLA